MKKKQPFVTQYPYLAHWIANWGYMQIGLNEDSSSLMLIDEEDMIYEEVIDETIDRALKKADKYIKKFVAPDHIDDETMAALEEDTKNSD